MPSRSSSSKRKSNRKSGRKSVTQRGSSTSVDDSLSSNRVELLEQDDVLPKTRVRKPKPRKKNPTKSSNQRRRTREERTQEFSVHGVGVQGDAKQQVRVRRNDRKRIKEVEKRGKSTLLQVDLPSLAARSLQLRKWRGRLGWIFAILCLSLLAFGVARLWVQQVLFAQPQALEWHMRVQSDGWREAGWVAKQLGFERGKPNLLDLDLEELAATLEADPGVVEAVLTRSLVGRGEGESVLRVELVERHPVAWLEVPARGLRPMSSAHGLLLDAQGYGWRPQQLRASWSKLPVIEAARLEQIPEDDQAQVHALLGAVALVEQLSQSQFVQRGLQPQRARVIWEGDVGMGLEPFRLEVETVAKQQLLFSLDEQLSGSLAQQCERLLLVQDRLAARGASFRRLNLCLPHQLPGELVLSEEPLFAELEEAEEADASVGVVLEVEEVIEPVAYAQDSPEGAAALEVASTELDESQEVSMEKPSLDSITQIGSSSVKPEYAEFEASFEDDLESVLQSQRGF